MEKKKLLVLLIMITMVVIIFILANTTKETTEYMMPTEDMITGNVIYEEPLTLEQLEQGVNLSGGWNVFKWTNELYNPIPAQEALTSLTDDYYYIYDYAAQKFFFNPHQKLADYKDQGYYKNRTFDKLEPGKKYAVYIIKTKANLQYEVSEPDKEEEEIEELREEKGLLNEVWFWIILIAIIIILYKKRVWIKRN